MPLDTSGLLQRFFGTPTYTQRVGDSTAEPGIDVSMAAGREVRAVTSGIFDQALSTSNELVEKIAVGGKTFYLDYMHIDPSSFKPGQTIKAGEVLGTITTKDEPGMSIPGGKSYFSTGPHVEFGVYTPGTKVGYDNNPGLDPIAWLSDLVGGRLGKIEIAKPDTASDTKAQTTGSNTAQAAGATGGALGWLFQMLGVGLDATGLGTVTGFFGRMFMTVFFIVVGTVFFFQGIARISVKQTFGRSR